MFHLFVDILVDLGRILGSQQAHSLGTFWAQIGEQGGGGGGRERDREFLCPFSTSPSPTEPREEPRGKGSVV